MGHPYSAVETGQIAPSPIERAGADTTAYDAEIVGLNKRQLTARVLTMEAEQAKREHLLGDPSKLADYAVDKGLSVDEMRALLQSNHGNNADRLARYKEVLSVKPDEPRAQIGWKELQPDQHQPRNTDTRRMKSFQRLQQHILATDRAFGQGIAITPRAERLRAAFRRGVAVGATAGATLMAAAAYVQVGPGSYDPQKLYVGDASDSRVMASIYDHHRKLLAARERVHDIKLAMIAGDGPESLEEQAAQFREARADEQRIAREFAQQTHGLSSEQIRHIVGDDDSSQDDSEIVAQAAPRFRP